MFEKYLKSENQRLRFSNAPMAQERLSYLDHLNIEGRSRSRLQQINARLLSMASVIDSRSERLYSSNELRAISEAWLANRGIKGKDGKPGRIARNDFHFIATNWLDFLGRLTQPLDDRLYSDHIRSFIQYLEQDLGYAAATCGNRRRSLEVFMEWLRKSTVPLAAISPKEITSYFISKDGFWGRTTVAQHVQSLRSFFRYAGKQGWCAKGIAETIDAPCLYIHENLPQGPCWEDVKKLLQSSNGESLAQVRLRCVLLLLGVYGLRAGEVCHLRLDDIDWIQDTIQIRRSKQRKSQTYPLTSVVGNAIADYLRIRPQSGRREIFLTLRQPYRPWSNGGFSAMIQKHERAIGLSLSRYGAHILRHSCATHLLAEGFSLKEVGDHLGHVSSAATRIYAKVDLNSLRKVAFFSLSGLGAFVRSCEQAETFVCPVGDLMALREVARLSLEGLL